MNAIATPADTAAPPLREDLRIAAVLAVAGALATAALFPYLLDLMPELRAKLHLPLALVVPLQALQGGVVLGAIALAGLRLGHRAGLGAPWLRALVAGGPRPALAWGRWLGFGMLTGVAVVGLLLPLDRFLPAPLHALPAPGPGAAWKGLLASFYGGIAEEIQMRLLLMTLLVWIVARLRGRAPGAATYWTAIAIAALAFGAGHLPGAASLWPLTTAVVVRTIVANGVAGLAFGAAYWKRGIEAAMLAHFGADLVLHVASPLLAG